MERPSGGRQSHSDELKRLAAPDTCPSLKRHRRLASEGFRVGRDVCGYSVTLFTFEALSDVWVFSDDAGDPWRWAMTDGVAQAHGFAVSGERLKAESVAAKAGTAGSWLAATLSLGI